MHALRRRIAVPISALGVVLAGAGVAGQPAAQRVTIPVEYHKLDNGLKVVLVARHVVADGRRRRLLQHRVPHRAEGPHRLRAPVRAHDVPGLASTSARSSSSSSSSRTAASSTARRASTSRTTSRSCPAHARDRLWAEADRMRGLEITQDNLKNQQDVVKNEVQGQRAEPAVRRVPVARPAAAREHELVQRAQLLRRPRGPRRGDARRRAAVLQDLLRAEQRRAGRRRRHRHGADARVDPEVLRRHPLDAAAAAARHLRAAAGARRSGRARTTRSRRGRRSRSATTCPRATRPSSSRWGCSTRCSCRAQDSRLYQALVQKRGLTGGVSGRHQRRSATCSTSRARRSGRVSLIHDADKPADEILKAIDEEVDEAADDAGRRRTSSSSRS